jgi:hypothetical protein
MSSADDADLLNPRRGAFWRRLVRRSSDEQTFEVLFAAERGRDVVEVLGDGAPSVMQRKAIGTLSSKRLDFPSHQILASGKKPSHQPPITSISVPITISPKFMKFRGLGHRMW